MKAHCPRLVSDIFYAMGTMKPHYMLQRLIMDCPKNLVVDHINGDTLNNQKYNLRICTREQNAMNQRTFDINTSGHRGVYYVGEAYINRWLASISIKRRLTCLGYFYTYGEACKAREDAEEKYYGIYARKDNCT